MKAKTTWIVVADSTRAFVMEHAGPGSDLKAVKGKQWTAAPSSEAADHPGRTFSSFSSSRSALEPHVKSQDEEEAFAKVIAAELATAQNSDCFDQLVLCAGPKMLSALVSSVQPVLGDYLRANVQKNLINIPRAELASHFDKVLLL